MKKEIVPNASNAPKDVNSAPITQNFAQNVTVETIDRVQIKITHALAK